MMDLVKEVNNGIESGSFDAFLNQLKKSLQDQPTKDEIKLPDLSPNLHHAPDINEDSETHGEQDRISRLTQTCHHYQDRQTVSNTTDREPPPQQAEHSDRD
jgi:hypothetical protein